MAWRLSQELQDTKKRAETGNCSIVQEIKKKGL